MRLKDDRSSIPKLLPASPAPFRIIHLGVWIAAAAMVFLERYQFASAMNSSLLTGPSEWQESTWESLYRILLSIGVGGQFMLLAFGMAAWRKCAAFPVQPGHWLTIFSSIVYVQVVISQRHRASVELTESVEELNRRAAAGLLLLSLCTMAFSIVSLALIVKRRRDGAWRAVYATMFVGFGYATLPLVAMFFINLFGNRFIAGLDSLIIRGAGIVTLAFPALIIVTILQSLMGDWLRERARDWAHLLGSSLMMFINCLSLVNLVAT